MRRILLASLSIIIGIMNSGTAYAAPYADAQEIVWSRPGASCLDARTGACSQMFNAASFNILHDGPDSHERIWKQRLPKSLNILKSNTVQVAGLQEVRPVQYRELVRLESRISDTDDTIKYGIFPENADGDFSPNPVIYNTKKFTFISGERREIKYAGGVPKHLVLVKLKENSSGSEFYFASTHDPANIRCSRENVSQSECEQQRKDNADKYIEMYSELSTDQTPFFLAGDFNSTTVAYCKLSAKPTIQHAYDAAKGISGTCKSKSEVGIDHIYLPEGGQASASAVKYLKKEYKGNGQKNPGGSENGSDHPTFIATISLGGECGSFSGAVTAAHANVQTPGAGSYSLSQRERVIRSIAKLSEGTAPDFITLNEIAPNTPTATGNYKSYKEDYPNARTTEDSALRILWDSTKWDKTDGGIEIIHEYTEGRTVAHSRKDRYALWATFESTTSNDVISVIATHWNTSAWRNLPRAKVQGDAIKALAEKLLPNGAVLINGDFNYQYSAAGEDRSPLSILSEIGLSSVFKRGDGTAVDWMFYSPHLKVTDKKVFVKDGGAHITDGNGTNLSDHPYLKASLEASGETSSVPSVANSSGSCTCEEDSASTNGVDIDRLLRAIAQRESGGDPTAEASGSTASGKYQYIDGTWQSRKSSYPPSGDYTHAANAPEPIQDAVAYIEYTKKIQDFNGDLVKIAVSHYYPIANTDPEKMDIVPPGNTLTPRQYAEGFKNSYDSNEGSGIPLKYQEAPEFDRYATAPTGSSVSNDGCGSGSAGFEDLDGVSMFYQNKEPWASQDYGIGTIEDCGCGPTSLAIAVKTLTGFDTDPKRMADWFVENGGQVGGGSCASNWIWQSKAALFESTYGIKVRSIGGSASSIKSALASGDSMVLMSQDSNGMFTSGGHIMLARGVNSDDKILVADPNSKEFSERAEGFTDAEIEAGLRAAWVIEKK